METSVSTFMDELHWSRKKCCGLMVVIMIVLGTASSMGYGLLDFIRIFGMNFLDFFDFMTNSVMMPLAALATCILILRVVGIDGMEKEIEQSSPFRRKKLYRVFIKYFAPICLIIILLSSIANDFGNYQYVKKIYDSFLQRMQHGSTARQEKKQLHSSPGRMAGR